MLAALCHQTFYTHGTWINEPLGVYVGWTTGGGTSCDTMPLHNERGNVHLVFSGEDYSDPERESRRLGNAHARDAESSYLVRAYEDDPDFPIGLNGKFHGVLADESRGTAMLFNDRYGIHPLYYHDGKEAFYFAAEIKGILAVCPELRVLDARGLGEFIACGCVFEQRTLFKDIHELPGAARWLFRNGSAQGRQPYFNPKEWEDQIPLTEESYYPTLRETFAHKLPRYFNGKQKVAISLTGGLDTRMIMAWQRSRSNSVPCYTFGGRFRSSRDVTISRKVAGICEQPHEVITVGDDFLAKFSHYAERTVYLTDGRAGVGRAPDLFVAERARAIAPVRIAGVYGSEVLRRSCAYKPWTSLAGLFCPELLPHLDSARKTYGELIRRHPVFFAAFAQAPQRGVNLLEQSQTTVRFPFLDNDLVQTAFRAPRDESATARSAADNDVCLRLIGDGNATLRRIPTDRGLGGDAGLLAGAMSRMFLEFTFKAEYAYDYGMPQWLAQVDHVFSWLHFERMFLGRHKLYHFRIWYRDALAGYVRDMLLDSSALSRPHVDRRALEAMILGHLKGNRNYTTEIHLALTLELVHRLFIDRR